MSGLAAQRFAFAATSRLTDAFPGPGARLLDAALRPTLGSPPLAACLAWRVRSQLRRPRGLRRFLVVTDIHIGDAVMMQSVLTALRDFFPEAHVDYAINRQVAPLVEGHPDATRVLPIFSGAHLPTADDLAALRAVLRAGRYDLSWNLSSFLPAAALGPDRPPLVSFVSHAPTLVRNERDPAEINHFGYQAYRFVRHALEAVARPVREERYPGARATYGDDAVDQAARYAAGVGLGAGRPMVMVNPDGACRFTVLPFEHQARLLHRVAAAAPAETVILMGAGHSQEGIGARLVQALPASLQPKVRIIPRSMPLEAYAALVDYADVYVTGDTGPMHLAAARRFSRSGRHRFRNRTAVLSIFGATVPRMSGYDSTRPGYLPSNQDAPSWCYQAASPCRNLSCLNKYFKTCRAVRCFDGVDVPALADLVVSHLTAAGSGTGPS